jgi:hypothetical protein
VAEEKEIEEVKKSVSERRREIEKRLSQENVDKKRDVQKSSETGNEVKFKSEQSKQEEIDEIKLQENILRITGDSTEKETSEEKAVSPEPSHLPFEQKVKTFELGIVPKEKMKSEQINKFINEEQKTMMESQSSEEEEKLSFHEKRLSFEKTLSMKKPGDKIETGKKSEKEQVIIIKCIHFYGITTNFYSVNHDRLIYV